LHGAHHQRHARSHSLLVLLHAQKSIAEVIKQIKGSSSHYINQTNLIHDKFAWQTGYAAYSVSESVVEKVYEYINGQKQHHQKKTFQHEYDEFIKLYGLESLENTKPTI
jgi:putative transposase